jgi:hypothetical protein
MNTIFRQPAKLGLGLGIVSLGLATGIGCSGGGGGSSGSSGFDVFPHQKISATQGEFTGGLDDKDRFQKVASLGDLDGDGVGDLAVGAWLDDDGGLDRGAVWILFLNADGTGRSHQKISSTEGSFGGALEDDDWFGWPVASLGDLDGDGVLDIAVGATGDDDGGPDRGALWILFLDIDGKVKFHQKISNTEGGFTGTLDDDDWFG